VTHVVIKAVGLALKAAPSINGRLLFGRFIPHKTVDVGCLVAIDDGRDLANAKITNVDKRSIEDISDVLKEKAEKLRQGKDTDFKSITTTLKTFPVFVLRYLMYIGGFFSSSLGLDIPFLGVRSFPFGSCLITSVGMMGLDFAFVPQTPFARVPVLVMIGAVTKKPVVEYDKIVIREVITITATLDHRYLDGAQAAIIAKTCKEAISNPAKFDMAELEEPKRD